MAPPKAAAAPKKHAFGWNCRVCTMYHTVPAPRCSMCGELRGATRQEMRDFVLGKRIPPLVEGNCVELLDDDSPEKKPPTTKAAAANAPLAEAAKENRHNHRPPPSLPKPNGMTVTDKRHPINPYFKPNNNKQNSHSTTNTNRGVVRNPYFSKRPQLKPPPQQPQESIKPQSLPASEALAPHENQTNQGTNDAASTSNKLKPHSFFDKATGNQQPNPASTKRKAPAKKQAQPTVHRFSFSPGPVNHDPEKALTYIYPKHPDFPTRQYQLEITETALNYNTLVSLPTGLGKTHIAAVVMYNYYRWFSSVQGSSHSGKVVFLAPTLPLVHQQIEACYKITGIPGHETAVLTGKLKASERQRLWQTRRVFYCTPQTVQKDLLGACGNGNPETERPCDDDNLPEDAAGDPETARAFSRVVCLVLDEAHKATGDYAYTRVVELLEKAAGAKFRIVGLSATPGTSIKAIQGVIEALRSCRIEARTDSDPTVAPYLHQKRTEIVVCPRNTAQREVGKKLTGILHPLLERLREEGGLQIYGNESLTSYTILKARQLYEARAGHAKNGGLVSCFHATHTLVQIRNDCHQGLGVVKTKLLRLKNSKHRGILSTVVKSEEFSELIQKVLDVTDGSAACEDVTDPKLAKLCELLRLHFEREQACDHSSRAIVFAQFRDSVKEIVHCLESNLKPLVRSRYFVGQNKGNASSSASSNTNNNSGKPNENVQGMKQAEQQRAIRDFRNNVFNVLVCTSIGEEGLDIGDVDLIINYDVISSPIRTIQRAGRTGRKRDGRVVSLIAEGPEEKTHKKRLAGEKTLLNALKNPRKFVMASHHPMLPHEPEKEYRVMEIRSKLALSQVAGAQHTPGASKRSEEKKKLQWRLDAAEEYERQTLCGEEMVSLDEDVTWDRLKGFFIKNRIDPSCLPKSWKINQRYRRLGKDEKDRLLVRRNKIRQKRQGNRKWGRIEGILESIKGEFGPVHSEGITRSGYKDILCVFPVDPVKESHISKSKSDSASGICKNLWKPQDSNRTVDVSPEASLLRAKTQPIKNLGNSASLVPPGPNQQGEKTSDEIVQNSDNNLPVNKPSPNKGPSTNATENQTKGGGSTDIGGVVPTRHPQDQNLAASKHTSSILSHPISTGEKVPQCPEAETTAFRLPTPPSSQESRAQPESGEKPMFRLPTPPPSSDSSVASETEAKGVFRLPTPPPSSDSGSDDDSDVEKENKACTMPKPAKSSCVLAQDNGMERKTTDASGRKGQQKHPDLLTTDREEQSVLAPKFPQKTIDANQGEVIFRLPTPPPSSSSDCSEGGDDGDTITVPEPKNANESYSNAHTGVDIEEFDRLDDHDSAIINLGGKFKAMERMDTVGKTSTLAVTTPKEKISIGFADKNDIALDSLKLKSSNRSKKKSDEFEAGDESEEDVPLISFSKKSKDKTISSKVILDDIPLIALRDAKNKKPNTPNDNSNVDKKVLPGVSFGKSPYTETKNKEHPNNTTDGNMSEEDIPLISLSNKKNMNRKSSQNLENDIPLIALCDRKSKKASPFQKSDGSHEQILALVSLGESHLTTNSKSDKAKEMSGSGKEDDPEDPPLSSLKETTRGGSSSNDGKDQEEKDENLLIAKDDVQGTFNRMQGNQNYAFGSDSQSSIIDQADAINEKKASRIVKTPNRTKKLLETDPSLKTIQSPSPNETIDQRKKRINCTKRPRILETPDSAYGNSNTSFPSTQNQSQNDVTDNSGSGKKSNTLPEISEVLESKSAHDHVDLTSTSSQNEIVDHSRKSKSHKRLRIGSEDDDTCHDSMVTANVIGLGMNETQQSSQTFTPSTSILKSGSSMLEDTPQTVARSETNAVKKRSASDLLTDTPITAVCNIADKTVCEICDSGVSTDVNPLVLCDGCNLGFHKDCYQITIDTESEDPWYCDSCRYSTSTIKIQGKSTSLKRNTTDEVSLRPKKLLKRSARCTDEVSKSMNHNSEANSKKEEILLHDTDDEESSQTRRERLRERRRQGLAKFVLDEAEIGSDQEKEDADEEEEVRRIEEEEAGYSQDSFINDNDILTQHFSQDLLGEIDPDAVDITDGARPGDSHNADSRMERNTHRVLDSLRERENQFRTPSFNRRMMRPPNSTPSSSQGLGNMNFIRSVLEHHRRGGDCDQIEAEYKRIEAATNSSLETTPSATTGTNLNRDAYVDLTTPPEENVNSSSHPPEHNENGNWPNHSSSQQRLQGNSSTVEQPTRIEVNSQNAIQQQRRQQQPPPKVNGLTAEQLARMEANRQRALQQQQSSQSGGLTAEQIARMEANRQKALRRRAELLAKKQNL